MKKWAVLFTTVFLLSVPCIVSATPLDTLLGSGELTVGWSTPIESGYYLDYNGSVTSDFNYTINDEEIFCVSEDHANPSEDVDFYKITPRLDVLLGISNLYDRLIKAAWIADNWTDSAYGGYSQDDVKKGEAQKAVWDVMGVLGGNWVGTSGIDYEIISAMDVTNYSPRHWYYAHSPSESASDQSNYQDYITPVPTPEPGTMLLFGVGLIGLASLRKRLKRS